MKLKSDIQDRYTPDPGEHPPEEDILCGVCGDKMDCKRDCYGPRGFVMAISGSKSAYDQYECPNREETWHKQVISLRKEKRKTASTAIEMLLDAEIETVLELRQHTKEPPSPFI